QVHGTHVHKLTDAIRQGAGRATKYIVHILEAHGIILSIANCPMLTLEPVQGLNQKYLQAEPRSSVKYRDLRDFIAQLEAKGDLKRITQPVSTSLEMTEISDRVLRAGGP